MITLITGASRGLGRSMEQSVTRRGGDVIITYRQREAEAAAVLAEIRALGRKALAFRLDAGDAAGFAAFAGRLRAALGETWSRGDFDHLVNADGGRIVNVSSGLTRVCFPGYAAYAAVKGAVEVLT